jgi:hypothetical protein
MVFHGLPLKSSGRVVVNTSSPLSSAGVGLLVVPWLSKSANGRPLASRPAASRPGPISYNVMRRPLIGTSSMTPLSSLGRLNAIPSEPT